MRITTSRRLLGESLESRHLLSGSGVETYPADPPDSAADLLETSGALEMGAVGSDTATGPIQTVAVSVNGQRVTLNPLDRLHLLPGDMLHVEAINFSSPASDGTFAAEGYINKMVDANTRSLIDYLDARVSSPEADQEATGGDGVVGGLSDAWEVEAGWDRLTVTLIHYRSGTAAEVAGRIIIRLQVGQPEFEFDVSVLEEINARVLRVGEAVAIPGLWTNIGAGIHHNYAEVDILHAANSGEVVWAGTLVGNAGPGQSVEGTFVNTREHDAFSELWIPEHQGDYVVKYYIDPENFASELDETNNEHEITITAASPDIVASDLTLNANNTMQVVSDSAVIYETETLYSEDFEAPEAFGGEFNPDGTDSATAGGWVAVTLTASTEWNGISLQLEAAHGEGALVTGDLPPFDERFVRSNWLHSTDFDESRFAWGFRLENTTWRRIETWAAHVKNANYDVDASQLTNQEAFTYTSIDHGDGTYDHLFVGTKPIMPYTTVDEIRLPKVDFGGATRSDGLVLGVLSTPSPGDGDLDGGLSSVRTETISLPAAATATLSLNYHFAYLMNATEEDVFRLTILGEAGSRRVVLQEFAEPAHHRANWRSAEFDLSEFAGQKIQLLIEAADDGEASLVEAGIDDILVTTTTARSGLWVASFTQPAHGTVTLDDEKLTFQYLAEAGFSGHDRFTYVLTNGQTFSNRATITVRV